MPNISNIKASIENQQLFVLDDHARSGTFLRDERGRPIAYTGVFSVVYHYRLPNGEVWAKANIAITNQTYNICILVQIKKYHPDWTVC